MYIIQYIILYNIILYNDNLFPYFSHIYISKDFHINKMNIM